MPSATVLAFILAICWSSSSAAPCNCTALQLAMQAREDYILKHLLRAITSIVHKDDNINFDHITEDVSAINFPATPCPLEATGDAVIIGQSGPTEPAIETTTVDAKETTTTEQPQTTTTEPQITTTEDCSTIDNIDECTKPPVTHEESLQTGSDLVVGVKPPTNVPPGLGCPKCPADHVMLPVVKFECRPVNEVKDYVNDILNAKKM